MQERGRAQGQIIGSLGTPDMTGTDGDCLPTTTINWSLFCRKELIHETVFRFTPKLKEFIDNFVKAFTKIHDNKINLFTSF